MKKSTAIWIVFATFAVIVGAIFGFQRAIQKGQMQGATVVGPRQGGTGVGTPPGYGQVLMGDGSGAYSVVPTSSLHISGGGGGAETDPIWTAASTSYLTTAGATNGYVPLSATATWNTAYGWGNHASMGYLTTSTGLTVNNFASSNISQWTNDSGYITSSAPAGNNTDIQFNNSGAFGGSDNLTWNGSDVIIGSAATEALVFNSDYIYTAGTAYPQIPMIDFKNGTNKNIKFLFDTGAAGSHNGSGFVFQANSGGDTNGDPAGDGGSFAVTAGTGGNNTETDWAGNGGSITLTAGNSGNDPALITGAGGSITLAPGSGVISNGVVKFKDPTSALFANFFTNLLSDNRDFTFPDKSGTFAMTSDLSVYLTTTTASITYLPLTANTSSWDTAYTDRLKWDGGATGLNASTGRTSLGLGSMALEANTGTSTITTLGTIGTGVWQGTLVSSTYGGTNKNTASWTGFTKLTAGVWATSSVSLTADVTGLLPLANFATGTSGYVLQAKGTSAPAWVTTSSLGISGGGTPGGTDGSIQFKLGSTFAGSDGLFWYEGGARFSAGVGNVVTGDYAVGIGADQTVTNVDGVGIGDLNTNDGDDSIVIGNMSHSGGQNTFTFGAANTATGSNSMALGFGAVVSQSDTIELSATNVGVNTATPSYTFQVAGTLAANLASGNGNFVCFDSSTKQIVYKTSACSLLGAASFDYSKLPQTNQPEKTDYGAFGLLGLLGLLGLIPKRK